MADAPEIEGGHAPLPEGLSPDWPVAWQPVWGTRDGLLARLEARAIHLALRAAGSLPEPLLQLLLRSLARIAPLVDRRHADAARVFLRQALGDMPRAELERRVRASYRHLLQVVVDSDRFPRRVPIETLLDHYDLRWSDEAREVLESGRGCILLTGHVGNWEAAIAAAPWVGFDPVFAIAKPPRNRPLSVAAQESRERRGVRLLPRRGAMAGAPAVLRAGGAIGMLLDQRARKRPVFAPLFGRPARCDRSAGVLLKRLKAPVVVVACYMTERPLHYRAEFFDVIRPEEVAGADVAEIAARINRSLETMILKEPDQYLWLHDRYKNTPETFSSEVGQGREGGGGIPSEGTLSSGQHSPEREIHGTS